MAKYKAYTEYKDSGVEWLGDIPSHWNVAKTMRYFKIAMGQTILKEQLEDDGEWPVYSATEGNSYFGYVSSPQVKLSVGDLVIPARGNSIGSVKLVSGKSTTTQTTIYCKHLTQAIYPAFAYYFMLGNRENLFWFTQTAIPQITVEEVGCNPILLPTYEEQGVVASFLDRETAKIDNLIEKQQQLIELLKEKRQAVISHAVTKGLNTDVPMKDSGVEWLGEVPEHWEVKRVKHFGKVIGGFAFKSSDFTDEGCPVIKISNVSHLSFDWGDSSFLPPSFSFTHKEYLAPKGALVFAMTRPVISGGIKVTLLDDDSAPLVNQRVGFMMVKSKNMARYILISTQSSAFLAHFVNNMTVTNQPNISSEGIESIYLPVPPMNEISRILFYVDRMNESYNRLIDKALLQVSLLQERRTALISAAVTGKIDVRDWVAPDAQDVEVLQEVIA